VRSEERGCGSLGVVSSRDQGPAEPRTPNAAPRTPHPGPFAEKGARGDACLVATPDGTASGPSGGGLIGWPCDRERFRYRFPMKALFDLLDQRIHRRHGSAPANECLGRPRPPSRCHSPNRPHTPRKPPTRGIDPRGQAWQTADRWVAAHTPLAAPRALASTTAAPVSTGGPSGAGRCSTMRPGTDRTDITRCCTPPITEPPRDRNPCAPLSSSP
jgi:hypothetical protein